MDPEDTDNPCSFGTPTIVARSAATKTLESYNCSGSDSPKSSEDPVAPNCRRARAGTKLLHTAISTESEVDLICV
jgi:hypothetical protein